MVAATAWERRGMAVAAMLEEIDRYCCDEKLLITYQWLSRKLNVPSDTSKRCAPDVLAPPVLAEKPTGVSRARLAAGCWRSTRRAKASRSSRCSSYLAGPRAAAARTALRSALTSTVRLHTAEGFTLHRGRWLALTLARVRRRSDQGAFRAGVVGARLQRPAQDTN